MSNFKRLSLLFLIMVFLLTVSGCFYVSGFNGGRHHGNSSYNSYKGSYGLDYRQKYNHRNNDRKYYRR